jgi:ABC-2 type transport system permease protein
MTVLAIAQATLRRLLRDRTALFFIVILPFLVIVLVGSVVGGFSSVKVGVVTEDRGPLSVQLLDALKHDPALAVHMYSSLADAKTALRRTEVAAAVDIPPGTDAALAAGRTAPIPVYGEQVSQSLQAASAAVSGAVAQHGATVQAARFATDEAGGPFAANMARAGTVARTVPQVDVAPTVVDTKSKFLPNGFNDSAPTMLVLFVFINALGAASGLIESRHLGMYERMSAGPVTAGRIVMGETLVTYAICVVQSILIVVVGAVVFGVDWGNPLAATALVLAWALVATGAGMLAGTVFRTPEQTLSIAPVIGILLAMLGGCMWPLEIVGTTMREVGHIAPHAWAVDGWTELMGRGGGIADIRLDLGVLVAFAAALLALASVRMRRALTA